MTALPPPVIDQTVRERFSVRIAADSGRVEVIAEQRDDVEVAGDAAVTRTGNRTTITGAHSRLTVRVPEDTDVTVGAESGRVDVSGAAGDVSVVSVSGAINISRARAVDARSRNGKIVVKQATGSCRLRSTSGSIVVDSCGGADAATESGRIKLRLVHGTASAHCISGRIDVSLAEAHDVTAETVTGRIVVTAPAGVRIARRDAAGNATLDDADCVVHAHSVSGRVEIATR